MGSRVVACLAGRYRLYALTHSRDRLEALRLAGAVPLLADLDDARSLARLGGLATTLVHLAPPPLAGTIDTRMRALLPTLHGVRRIVYVSTTGVYGDCRGEWIDETRPTAPATDRARRRVDAEDRLRAWALATGNTAVVLRVPGIYANDRLPVERLRKGTPVLRAEDDVYTNHIHADDLARLIVLAIQRGRDRRVYHAVDDSAMRMGDWFDLVADAHALPRPPRIARSDVGDRIAPGLASFMSESRRLSNLRMRVELGMRLRYRTVCEGLAAAIAR